MTSRFFVFMMLGFALPVFVLLAACGRSSEQSDNARDTGTEAVGQHFDESVIDFLAAAEKYAHELEARYPIAPEIAAELQGVVAKLNDETESSDELFAELGLYIEQLPVIADEPDGDDPDWDWDSYGVWIELFLLLSLFQEGQPTVADTDGFITRRIDMFASLHPESLDDDSWHERAETATSSPQMAEGAFGFRGLSLGMPRDIALTRLAEHGFSMSDLRESEPQFASYGFETRMHGDTIRDVKVEISGIGTNPQTSEETNWKLYISEDDSVIGYWFNAPALHKLFRTPAIRLSEFAQAFIDNYNIPSLQPEQEYNAFWERYDTYLAYIAPDRAFKLSFSNGANLDARSYGLLVYAMDRAFEGVFD